MFGRSFRIATLRGIPVNVDSSWIWIAVLAVMLLWSRLQGQFQHLGDAATLAYAVLGAGLFFGSVFLHELAHAVTARLSGIHVEGITLVFFGGFTSARSEEKGAAPALLISAAGPGTSLALSGAFWALSRATDGSAGPLSGLLGYVGFINLLMAIFNLMPGLPLDGGRVLQAIVWRVTRSRDKGTRIAARVGMGLGVLLFAGAVFELTQESLFGALWLAIIGTFIFQGARASEQQIGIAKRLARGTVADAMEPPPPTVPAELSLSETLDRFLRGREAEVFPVEEGGRVIGLISFGSAREVGVEDPLRPARDALIPLETAYVTHPDERLDELSRRLEPGKAALVLRDGVLVGSISGTGLYRWASARAR